MTPAARPLTYADARRIRRDAAELAEQLPRIVTEQRDAGTPAARIAADLDLTESYVHQLIRRQGHPYDWTLRSALGVDVDGGTIRAPDDVDAATLATAAVRGTVVQPPYDEDTHALIIRRRGRNTGPDSWTQYEADVLHVTI